MPATRRGHRDEPHHPGNAVRRGRSNHFAQLAASQVHDRRFDVERQPDIVERLERQIVVQCLLGRMPLRIAHARIAGLEAQRNQVGAGLHQLEPATDRCVLDDRGQRQRRQANDVTVARA
jgi:hypothetical protein